MISIKRDTKGNLKEATGIRSRASSMYEPGQSDTFKISRSKFSDYINCKRCFYLQNRIGIKALRSLPFRLNSATDTLLKQSFDLARKKQEPHRYFKKDIPKVIFTIQNEM